MAENKHGNNSLEQERKDYQFDDKVPNQGNKQKKRK